MNVYVVTEGCYSGYGIEKIFSTREFADNYVTQQRLVGNDVHDVEEWELDTFKPCLKAKPIFPTVIYLDDGRLEINNKRIYPTDQKYSFNEDNRLFLYIKTLNNYTMFGHSHSGQH